MIHEPIPHEGIRMTAEHLRACQAYYQESWCIALDVHASVPYDMWGWVKAGLQSLLAHTSLCPAARSKRVAKDAWMSFAHALRTTAQLPLHHTIRQTLLEQYVSSRPTGTNHADALSGMAAPAITWRDIGVHPDTLEIVGEIQMHDW